MKRVVPSQDHPPLRPREMVEAMWGDVAAGHIDFVSTDIRHGRHEVKSDPNIFKNSSAPPAWKA